MNWMRLLIVMGFGLVGFIAAPEAVMAQTGSTQTIQCGVGQEIDLTGTQCVGIDGADEVINNTIQLAIRILQIIVGILSVIMIIFGGIKYITSGGDSSSVTSAKNTIIYALIGLVVVALAEIIVQFVLNRVDSV